MQTTVNKIKLKQTNISTFIIYKPKWQTNNHKKNTMEQRDEEQINKPEKKKFFQTFNHYTTTMAHKIT